MLIGIIILVILLLIAAGFFLLNHHPLFRDAWDFGRAVDSGEATESDE